MGNELVRVSPIVGRVGPTPQELLTRGLILFRELVSLATDPVDDLLQSVELGPFLRGGQLMLSSVVGNLALRLEQPFPEHLPAAVPFIVGHVPTICRSTSCPTGDEGVACGRAAAPGGMYDRGALLAAEILIPT